MNADPAALPSSAARAQAYGFLATAFRQPDPEWALRLRSPESWAVWPEAIGALDPEVGAALESARREIAEPGFEPESSAAFVRLFGHTLRGQCPAHELEFGHGEIFQKSAELADIQGFYAAFGVEVDEDGRERADHVSAEMEFMLILLLKEAYAEQSGDAEGIDILRSAQRRFLESHVGAWLPAFASRVEDAAGRGFHAEAARFARRFIAQECASMGAACGSGLVELRPTHEESETSIDCMTAENCGSCPLESLMPATFASKDSE